MPRSRLAAAIWSLGLAAAGLQALALAARYFQPWLSADYIYPQLFAEDVFAGRYPLAGWTMSSAPYFFPDMTVAIILRALGGAGTVLPAYVVFSYLTLAVVAGWSLQRATGAGWAAWLGGVALVNALLVWQPVTDHAHYLWLLGTVGFHGGAVLLGLASFALWAGPAETGPSRRRRAVALAILFLGAFSDSLFLTQAALPLGLGLWARAGWNGRDPRLRTYALTLALALGLVALVRIALAWGGWFRFSKVVRYAPVPSVIGRATASFLHDLWVTLIPGAAALPVLALVALLVVGLLWWRERRRQPRPAVRQPATVFALAGLAATTLLPLLTGYWRDANHARYILPWLVLPGWLAMVWLLPRIKSWAEDWRPLAAMGLIWLGLIATALPQIRPAALGWPYPERQAELDAFLAGRGLTHGLSDYWHAHEINTLTHGPVRLFALRPQGNVSFWSNNAYWFYDSHAGRLSVPAYTFIITDGLDEAALLQRFGEPAGQERVGGMTIWLYAGPAAHALTDQIEPEVRAFLRGRPGEGLIGPGR